MTHQKCEFVTTCVTAKAEYIQEMVDQSLEITYDTFARHVNTLQLEHELGYGEYMRLKDDWAVRFYRSKYCGKQCYYMDHSAIEYVFV